MNEAFPLHGQASALVEEFKPLLDVARPHLIQPPVPQRRVGESQIPMVPELAPDQAQSLLGQHTVEAIAHRLNLMPAAVAAAAAFALPRMAELFIPGELASASAASSAATAAEAAAAEAAATFRAGALLKAPSLGSEQARPLGWLIPAVLVLIASGLVWLFSERAPIRRPAPPLVFDPAPVVQAPPAEPVPVPMPMVAPGVAPGVAPVPAPDIVAVRPPAPGKPARLSVSVVNGMAILGGKVGSEEARAAVTAGMATAYGAGHTQGNVTVDPTIGTPGWLPRLGTILASLRMNGVRALFNGESVAVGGAIPAADRDRLIGAVRTALAGTATGTSGPLASGLPDFSADASQVAQARLMALRPGFTAPDVTAILNATTINFANKSATVPGADRGLLAQAAARLQTLPAGTKIEIAGYTDATGSAAGNTKLSQRRADAVRSVLTKAGVTASGLTAKGYGASNPVASNETEEGRYLNRRIEYRVMGR